MLDSLHHSRIFGPFPHRSHPFVHHDTSVSVHQDPEEEQYNGWDKHHPQSVELVVLRNAGAVEVKAGVELDTHQGQNDTDPIGNGLGVGLKVLQDQLHAIHSLTLARQK